MSTPHRDELLTRIRLPGGMLAPAQLSALARIGNETADQVTTEMGTGAVLELTRHGDIQLRSYRNHHAVPEMLRDAGLLVSPSHEHVRNILATPLSGRTGDFPDIRPMVTELDRRLIASPGLASLPGHFVFSIDDGRGDVSVLAADIGLRHEDGGWRLWIAGRPTSYRSTSAADAIGGALGIAELFCSIGAGATRVADLPGGAPTFTETAGLTLVSPQRDPTPVSGALIGWIEQHGGDLVTLGAAVPRGELLVSVATLLAAAGKPIVITPWNSLLLCDLQHDDADAVLRVLAPRGLVFDERSPWVTGQPGT